MNGLEATKIIRSLGYGGIIIGVTGNVNDEDIREFLEKGADVVLPKPLDVKELIEAVDRVLISRESLSHSANKKKFKNNSLNI
eukprot:CAMPEP_0182434144 /NCGR_PEP_ID=MMETSP1167-20130531/67998_1 /TAXON_ID=2988 /ORGANISM="Mallomonas Sp, Strain CCMP3275" /LENGTH=82 /DNA_ID=CAMNT_0024623669 /DNA_START=237 /DNA_END=485 /DNA_ORIENTATION=+